MVPNSYEALGSGPLTTDAHPLISKRRGIKSPGRGGIKCMLKGPLAEATRTESRSIVQNPDFSEIEAMYFIPKKPIDFSVLGVANCLSVQYPASQLGSSS